MILILEIVLLLCEIALAWFILGLVKDLRDIRDQIRSAAEDIRVEPLRVTRLK